MFGLVRYKTNRIILNHSASIRSLLPFLQLPKKSWLVGCCAVKLCFLPFPDQEDLTKYYVFCMISNNKRARYKIYVEVYRQVQNYIWYQQELNSQDNATKTLAFSTIIHQSSLYSIYLQVCIYIICECFFLFVVIKKIKIVETYIAIHRHRCFQHLDQQTMKIKRGYN